MKAVLDTKVESAYDDEIASRYHFPSRYLDVLSACIGDWVVFRQPRAGGGTKAYFAAGRVDRIDPDPNTPGHHYAVISEYLPFAKPAPWRANGRYAEAALREIENVAQVGVLLRGRSVRRLSDEDFSDIVGIGVPRAAQTVVAASLPMAPTAREVVQALVNRKVRDDNFRDLVCDAYQGRCAMTGWSMRDGKGNCEAQGAHIWSVADGGPDIVPNGLALTGTAHWLFDRHLVSITDDLRLIASKQVSPDLLAAFRARQFEITAPSEPAHRPFAPYLARHRQIFESNVSPQDRVSA